MKLSAFVQQIASNRFRAWCVQPVQAEAEGTTREEAITKLRTDLEAKTRDVDAVQIIVGRSIPTKAIWPDDEFTRDWLAGIIEARAKADRQPDPWDVP